MRAGARADLGEIASLDSVRQSSVRRGIQAREVHELVGLCFEPGALS